MKVIFLDHDGVICLSSEWGSRSKKIAKAKKKMSQDILSLPVHARFDNFNQKAVKVLNSILEQTGAEIVVSSDWKSWASVDEMGDYYESQGIIKRPIDFTGNVIDSSKFHCDKDWDLECTRSLEISAWLEEHKDIEYWVAVDDLNMGKMVTKNGIDFINEWGLSNFVHTPKSNEGIKQLGLKEKIISYL